MRTAWTLLAILALPAILTAPATAGSAEWTDPEGDVTLSLPAGQKASAPGAATASSDLVGLRIDETDDTLSFIVTLADISETTMSEFMHVDFTWGGITYAAVYESFAFMGGKFSYAYLAIRTTGDRWEWEGVGMATATTDAAAKTIRLDVPKVYIQDKAGRPPVKGSELKDISVSTSNGMLFNFFLGGEQIGQARDRLPNEGGSTYEMLVGDEAVGHLSLSSWERVRVSNGGATTFVFRALIKNHEAKADTVKLSFTDMPAGWNATVIDRLPLGPNEDVGITMLITVPFGHDHGGYSAFTLRAQSTRVETAYATIRMGVLHTPIPQPAGHHDELFIHAPRDDSPMGTVFSGTSVSMNTLADRTGERAEIEPTGGNGGTTWDIPLSPGLKMGLDFDLERLGDLVGKIAGGIGDATVSAELLLLIQPEGWWADFNDGLLLAEAAPVDITLTPNGAVDFALKLTPTDDADYIPYEPYYNLGLRLRVQQDVRVQCCLPNANPRLVADAFKLTLPLNEYHDRLDGAAELAEGISLIAEGKIERAARPGTLVTYAFTLKNSADKPLAIDLDLAGSNAAAGQLAPSGSVTLGPREERKITLAVRVPAEAAVDQQLEVLVFAHAKDDPSIAAIARTITTVTKGDGAAADETAVFAAAQQDTNDTPGLGMIAVIAAVGAAALVMRTRRR